MLDQIWIDFFERISIDKKCKNSVIATEIITHSFRAHFLIEFFSVGRTN